MGFLKFIFFSAVMFAVLTFAWKMPPGVPRDHVWLMHAAEVLAFYAMGALVWAFTRIFVKTPALRMSTVYAFVFLGLAFFGRAYLESLGASYVLYPGLTPAPIQASPPPPAQPQPVPAQTAKRSARPPAEPARQQPAEPACQRHEDRERGHVTITCR